MSEDVVPNTPLRTSLGDFSSIVCFKAVVVGVEDALGERAAAVALKAAGRKRGHQLIGSLGLKGMAPSAEDAQKSFFDALGPQGTRLCIVDKVEIEDEVFRVHTRETICSSAEEDGSPRKCTYTLGAIHGAMEALYNIRLRGKQIDSVLRGGTHDVFEFVER